jgi:hypothetical protein
MRPWRFCPVDGLFVAHGAASATDGAKRRILDCATVCPTCGRHVELLPGLYEADGDHLNFLLDPSVSDAALAELRKLLVALQAGEITPEDAEKEAEKVHRGWGAFFNFSQWAPEVRGALIASLITAAATIVASRMSSSPSVTVNNYIQMPPAVTETVTPRKRNLLMGSTSLTPHFVQRGHRPATGPHNHKRHQSLKPRGYPQGYD